MKIRMTAVLAASLIAATALAQTAPAGADRHNEVARGRYLVQVSGCNDCHTPGYTQNGGKTDEKLWLTGDALGWKGPWGTTYPSNLRLLVGAMTREQWIAHARKMEPRPPMPWFNVRAMTDADLGAIHAYIKAAGPAGKAAPAYAPPGQPVQGPVVQFPQ